MRALLVAFALLLAGCAGSPEDAPEAVTEIPGDGPSETDEPQDGPSEPVPVEEYGVPGTLYLRGDGGTSEEAPAGDEPQRVPFGNPWASLLQGGEFPAWRGPAAAGDYLITSATFTFFVTSEGASVAAAPGGEGLPEFFLWFGPEDAPMGGGTARAPDVIVKDQVVEVSVDLNVPAGGQVLRAGEVPFLMIGATYWQDDSASRVVLLTEAASTPSRVDLVAEPVVLPAEGEHVPVLDEAGSLRGDACQAPPTEGSFADFPVEIPATAVGFHAELARTGGTPGLPDLDLHVFDANGNFITSGHTPKGDEIVRLHVPNLEAAGRGTWTLHVRSCAAQNADFTLKAWAVTPVAAPATEVLPSSISP